MSMKREENKGRKIRDEEAAAAAATTYIHSRCIFVNATISFLQLLYYCLH